MKQILWRFYTFQEAAKKFERTKTMQQFWNDDRRNQQRGNEADNTFAHLLSGGSSRFHVFGLEQ
jgi:hypothetical protein